MDINSFIVGLKKGRCAESDRFPAVDFINGTVEELDLKGVTVLRGYSVYTQKLLKKLSIPDVERIEAQAIQGCTILESLTFPKSLKQIAVAAIVSCSALTTVTFEGTPTSLNSSSMMGCPNVKTVNVPWAEGEVAGAPWGMGSATINYNYKGD